MATGATPATDDASNPDPEARFPTGPNGRLETVAEKEHRLAVNTKMRFHRSLLSSSHAHIYCVCEQMFFLYIAYINIPVHKPR